MRGYTDENYWRSKTKLDSWILQVNLNCKMAIRIIIFSIIMPPTYNGGSKQCYDVSVCFCSIPVAEQWCILQLWLLQNTDMKGHAGSWTYCSVWPWPLRSDRTGNKLIASTISEAFAMWLHHQRGCVKLLLAGGGTSCFTVWYLYTDLLSSTCCCTVCCWSDVVG